MFHFFSRHSNSHAPKKILGKFRTRGFSLLELLVVVTIMVILSTVILIDYDKHLGAQSLTLAAQELAVSIREMQVYGLAVKELPGAPAGSEFPDSYGVHFNNTSLTNPDNNTQDRVTFFADTYTSASAMSGGFKRYDSGAGQDILIRNLSYTGPIIISEICVHETGLPGSECVSVQNATVFFKRPSTEPVIYNNPTSVNHKEYRYVRISLYDIVNENQKIIYVWSSGQIAESAGLAKITYQSNNPKCPLVYSWDGDGFTFEHKAQSIPFASRYATYRTLGHLDDTDGKVTIRIEDPQDDTFIDSYSVLAVDISTKEDIEILSDADGKIHVIQTPVLPTLCVTENGDLCDKELSQKDDNSLFIGESSSSKTHSSFMVTFDKPLNDSDGKLIINFNSHEISDAVLGWLQQNIFAPFIGLWNETLANSKMKDISGLSKFEEATALRVSLRYADTQISLEDVYADFNGSKREVVIPFSQDFLQGKDSVTVNLSSRWWYLVDTISIDWSSDVSTQAVALPLLEATAKYQEGKKTITETVMYSDQKYYHINPDNSIEMVFETPAKKIDTTRKYIGVFSGYYLLGTSHNPASFKSVLDTTQGLYFLYKEDGVANLIDHFNTVLLTQ